MSAAGLKAPLVADTAQAQGDVSALLPRSSRRGYVHFSRRHILSAITPKEGAGEGEYGLCIGPDDTDKPLAYYREPVAAFLHIMLMIPVAAEDGLARLTKPPTA